MGILNNIIDAFNKAEFTVAPNKKLKTISADFKKAFDLTLVFYKGAQIADPELTLNQLGKKTTKEVKTTAEGIKIKGNVKVGDAEKQFNKAFGVTVQIKDKSGKNLVPNEITIGQAARGEFFETICDHRERLDFIIKTAYDIVCKKIASGCITIFNEASLQLHLGTVLKELGHLYEFAKTDRFVIELEKNIDGITPTSKSGRSARCDIVVSFEDDNGVCSLAFIELKYFKESNNPKLAEPTKDNRFSLFMDMENLENYRSLFSPQERKILCYEIAVVQNKTYTNAATRSILKTGNGCWTDDSRTKSNTDSSFLVRNSTQKPIDLKGNYQFEWKSYAPDKHFLMVKMQ